MSFKETVIVNPKDQPVTFQQNAARAIEKMRKTEGHTLGFIPKRSFMEAIERDRIFVAVKDIQLAGFVMWGKVRETVSVYMLCVDQGFRREGIGRELIKTVIKAQHQKHVHVQCRVREDLTANQFWLNIGFKRYDRVAGGKYRGLLINRYELHVEMEGTQWIG